MRIKFFKTSNSFSLRPGLLPVSACRDLTTEVTNLKAATTVWICWQSFSSTTVENSCFWQSSRVVQFPEAKNMYFSTTLAYTGVTLATTQGIVFPRGCHITKKLSCTGNPHRGRPWQGNPNLTANTQCSWLRDSIHRGGFGVWLSHQCGSQS